VACRAGDAATAFAETFVEEPTALDGFFAATFASQGVAKIRATDYPGTATVSCSSPGAENTGIDDTTLVFTSVSG
jgi:hypothetical protein